MLRIITSSVWGLLLILLLRSISVTAKELVATSEWQRVGPTDTLPAGLEIRMDLSGGGKWARLLPVPPKELNPTNPSPDTPHKKRCGPSCKERQNQRAAKRRSAGFLLREATHHRRDVEVDMDIGLHGSSTSSIFQQGTIFLVGLGLGLGVATRVRRRNGLHEH